jgi:hypothetical protein
LVGPDLSPPVMILEITCGAPGGRRDSSPTIVAERFGDTPGGQERDRPAWHDGPTIRRRPALPEELDYLSGHETRVGLSGPCQSNRQGPSSGAARAAEHPG